MYTNNSTNRDITNWVQKKERKKERVSTLEPSS